MTHLEPLEADQLVEFLKRLVNYPRCSQIISARKGMRGVKAGGSTVLAKLRGLVAPRETAKPVTKDKKELLANSSPEQCVDGEMSRTEKQAGEQTVNGYDAHA